MRRGYTPIKAATLAAVAAFVLYAACIVPYLHPGESIAAANGHLGVSVFRPLTNGLWGSLVRVVARIPAGSLPWRLNLLSAACGAGAVGLFFLLLCSPPSLRCTRFSSPWDFSFVRGIAGTAFLAVSAPFLAASTRAHPTAFELCILFGALLLFTRYQRSGNRGFLYAFSLVYAVAVTESTAAILAAPAVALVVAVELYRKRDFTIRPLLVASLCGILGLSVYVLNALQFKSTPAFALRAFDSVFQAIWFLWRDQWLMVSRSVPRTGWLLVALTCMLPAAAVAIGVLRRKRLVSASQIALHLALLSLTLAVLFGTMIAPWRILGENMALAASYAVLAFAFGQLAARTTKRLAPDRPARRALILIVAGGVLLSASIRNISLVRAPEIAVLHHWSRATLAGVADAELLVSGSADEHLQFEYSLSRNPPRLLALRAMKNKAYRRFLAEQHPSAALRSLLDLPSPLPFFREWIRSHPDGPASMGVTDTAELWTSLGYYWPAPRGLVYRGFDGQVELDCEALSDENERIRTSLFPTIKRLADRPGSAGSAGRALLKDLSRLANNTGVTLDNNNRGELAMGAYRFAAEADRNPVVLINLAACAKALGDDDFADATLNEAMLRITKSGTSHTPPANIRRLMMRHGMLSRNAVMELYSPTASDSGPALLEARQALRENDTDRARSLLDSLVRTNPAMDLAWILRGVMAAQLGDMAGFDETVKRMRATGRSWPPILTIMAHAADTEGKREIAVRLCEEALAVQPYPPAMEKLLRLLDRPGDEDRRIEIITALLTLNPLNAHAHAALGKHYMKAQEPRLAEACFRRSMELSTNRVGILPLTAILLDCKRVSEAEAAISAELARNSGNYDAWVAAGLIHLSLKHTKEAVTAFHTALKLEPHRHAARRYLAALLMAAGREEEAERLRLPVGVLDEADIGD